MAYRTIKGPYGKSVVRVHFSNADKMGVRRTIHRQDGSTYNVMDDGSQRRVSPVRLYRGKSGRRAFLKQRRLEKAAK